MAPRIVLLTMLAACLPMYSQTATPVEPNAEGVSMLHVHLFVRDVDAQRGFWLALTGDTPSSGRVLLVGGLPLMIQEGEPVEGSEASAIDYVAFRVRDLRETLARLKAAGGRVLPEAESNVTFVMAPEDVKVALAEDASLEVPVVQDYVHLALPSAREALSWYAKTLGAVPNPDGEGLVIPGVVLRITEGQTRPTSKGRSLDHIAFSVGEVDQFCERLTGMGINTEPMKRIGTGGRAYTYMTDPWGAYIELMGTTARPAN